MLIKGPLKQAFSFSLQRFIISIRAVSKAILKSAASWEFQRKERVNEYRLQGYFNPQYKPIRNIFLRTFRHSKKIVLDIITSASNLIKACLFSDQKQGNESFSKKSRISNSYTRVAKNWKFKESRLIESTVTHILVLFHSLILQTKTGWSAQVSKRMVLHLQLYLKASREWWCHDQKSSHTFLVFLSILKETFN